MEQHAFSKNEIMAFEFYDEFQKGIMKNQNPMLIYVLDGTLDITLENVRYHLTADHFMVLNANEDHRLSSDNKLLAGVIYINQHLLTNYVDMSDKQFFCNTTVDKDEAYDEIRLILKKIFGQYFYSQEIGEIYVNSLYYSLLSTMLFNFTVGKKNELDVDSKRISDITAYIYANYQYQITLNDLSEKLFLSSSYLSKYIKKHLGTNFLTYLNKVRLEQAMKEMMQGQKSILHIALDNGFPNAYAFNKTFKEMYKMTPSAWQEQKADEDEADAIRKNKLRVNKKIKRLLETEEEVAVLTKENVVETLEVDKNLTTYSTKHWNQMINIFSITNLLRSDMQDHLLIIKKELGIQYIRFWDVFSDEMMVIDRSEKVVYNYTRLDKAIDFLVYNGLRPFVELGFKPNYLLRHTGRWIVQEEREIIFKTIQEYCMILREILSHWVNRYGIEEVSSWYFEQWGDARLTPDGEMSHYFEVFEASYHTIKEFSPDIKIGGLGFSRLTSKLEYEHMVRQWNKRNCYPDYISLYSYPYRIQFADDLAKVKSRDPEFLAKHIEMMKEVVSSVGFSVSEINVTEWNFTVSNWNVLNDSCYNGAYILKNIIDNIGQIEILAYWSATDIMWEHIDRKLLLNGGGGLLTVAGIRKPAFFAIEFANRLGKYILGKSANGIVTSNGHDNYYISCHNYIHPNFKYFVKNEDEIDVDKQFLYFDDAEKIQLKFRIDHVKNGSYQVKIHSINDENGSVQDVWREMGLSDKLNQNDIEYLRRICTPKITIRRLMVEDGVIDYTTELKPHEIQHIQLAYQF